MLQHVCGRPAYSFLAWMLFLFLNSLPSAVHSASWNATGSMSTARHLHTATLLANGKVLVAGGFDNADQKRRIATTELYDPATGTWSDTGSMKVARGGHTAILLKNGKVLVAGCSDTTAELYDSATGTWSNTGSMNVLRCGTGIGNGGATLLADGKVLFATGDNGVTAELYDPANGTWSITGSLKTSRIWWDNAPLPNGKVLAAGGWSGSSVLATAELYDPATGTWSSTGSMSRPYHFHAAVSLPNGKVLVAGGRDAGWRSIPVSQLYDPTTGIWNEIGSNPAGADLSLTRLANGKVLAAGGANGTSQALATADLYDPATNIWIASSPMNIAHGWCHSATLLHSGKVLIAGGSNGTVNFAAAELYTPDNNCSDEIAVKPYTFTAGTPAKAAEINANFDVLYQRVNTPRCQ